MQYGLEISERHPTTSAVVPARCLFCVKVGRTTSKSSIRKRARTENVQYYRFPFRSDSMKKNAEQQHPEAFAEYSGLGDAEKSTYIKMTWWQEITLCMFISMGKTLYGS
jgi:hypothetical protein